MKMSLRHVRRYREIAETLARHGFGFILDYMGITRALSLPARLFKKKDPPTPLTAPSRVRTVLESLGPTFIKLGQIASTRPDLIPPDYLAELAKLQDQVPPVSALEIRRILIQELGRPVEEVFASFEDEPVASASIAQVHTAVLNGGKRVAVKIQRPGIDNIIGVDMEIIANLADVLDRRSPWAEHYNFSEAASELAETLREELDFTMEAQNVDHFRLNFEDDHHVAFPHVYHEYSTRHVLVLEFMEGIKIDQVRDLAEAGHDLSRIAATLIRALFKQIFVDGFFHADPHPGNLLVNQSGQVVFLDMGMVGQLDQITKKRLVQLVLGIIGRKPAQVVRAMEVLSVLGPNTDTVKLQRDISRLIGRYYHVPLEKFDMGEAMQNGMGLAFRHHLRLPADLTLMGKALSTGEGVARQLDPDLSLVKVAEPFRQILIHERFSWQELLEWSEGLRDGALALFNLPAKTGRIMDKLNRGEITIHHVHERLDQFADKLGNMINRLALSILVAGLIVGTSLAGQRPGKVIFFNTTFGDMGFFIATGLGIWLIWSILKSGRG